MKTQINLTTSCCDLDRFSSREELLELLEGEGIELMCYEEDERGIVPPERVTGLHMSCLPNWLDFWKGDRETCLREFDNAETIRSIFGGETPEALLAHYRKDLQDAQRYGAEYMVFHVCNGSIEETFTGRSCHSDEEVIDAAAELLNELFSGVKDGPWLLLENLWYAGHRFTEPEMTARLLEKVRYPKTGLMLDTGHLMHTCLSLKTQEDGVRYIHEMLDRHGDLAKHIRGVHLNQSITGEIMAKTQQNPPKLLPTYQERNKQLFYYVFSIDLHQPFTCPGVKELIERISPEYLTYEFISNDLEEHREMLKKQRAVFR
ncbi:MAG: TIM barrel protein [Lachnospiraceae bacterium]|nr:TIM barrel protein [Lachnospiraceae bacterium]